MQDTFFSKEKKLSAIIFCHPADPVSGKTALKYSYVHNSERSGVNKFIQFAKKFPKAIYVNFYERKSGNKAGRVYLVDCSYCKRCEKVLPIDHECNS